MIKLAIIALKMAVVQSGDSDSVAAIAGGFLGVMGKRVSSPLLATLSPKHEQGVVDVSHHMGTALAEFKQAQLNIKHLYNKC